MNKPSLATAEGRSIRSIPEGPLVDFLNHAEALWRIALPLDTDASCFYSDSLYTIADRTLTEALSRAYGEIDGREVRDVMADCMESWAYCAGNVRQHRAWQDAEAFTDAIGWPW